MCFRFCSLLSLGTGTCDCTGCPTFTSSSLRGRLYLGVRQAPAFLVLFIASVHIW
jgi:hypothetical protein